MTPTPTSSSSTSSTKSKVTSIESVRDKVGRIDVLLHGIAKLGLAQLETKTNLPGLVKGLMPIVEKEIKTYVPKGKVIPKEYEELARLFSEKWLNR